MLRKALCMGEEGRIASLELSIPGWGDKRHHQTGQCVVGWGGGERGGQQGVGEG